MRLRNEAKLHNKGASSALSPRLESTLSLIESSVDLEVKTVMANPKGTWEN